MLDVTETSDAFWKRHLETLPAGHAHRNVTPDVFAFGDSPSLADELAALALSGRKRATASLPVEFTSRGLPLPLVGDISIVTTASGRPVTIIELTEVRHMPFGRVDEAFASAEGEGDGSLTWWRNAHRTYFTSVCARHGDTFDEATAVICQRFSVLFNAQG